MKPAIVRESEELQILAQEIQANINAAEKALMYFQRIGQALIKAKSLCKHGEWLPWLKSNFPYSRQTAAIYMRLSVAPPENLPGLVDAIKHHQEEEEDEQEPNGKELYIPNPEVTQHIESQAPNQMDFVATEAYGLHVGLGNGGDSEPAAETPETEPEKQPAPPVTEPEPTQAKKEEQDPEPTVDPAGVPIPERCAPAFFQVPNMNRLCRDLDGFMNEVRHLGASPAGVHLYAQNVLHHLKNARTTIWDRRPTYVCPYCHGLEGYGTCKPCNSSGWVTKTTWASSPAAQRGQ